ncbi:helix-turn-helix domain-containing protein [Epilithonimonas sp.]|uniref:helix-turn-helix domain-containing protein n=1 Tax=Epilithonimonas sp. TaxID=2894511 RepID=UPI0028A13E55|nr:helix-turn-helix domain-containing protein [Epilithonimonas sp.]
METPKKKSSEKFLKDIRKNTRRIFTAEQKILIVMQAIATSKIGVKQTLESLGIARSTFYKWYQKYFENGYAGLKTSKRTSKRQ